MLLITTTGIETNIKLRKKVETTNKINTELTPTLYLDRRGFGCFRVIMQFMIWSVQKCLKTFTWHPLKK